jgi:hypothetical protein
MISQVISQGAKALCAPACKGAHVGVGVGVSVGCGCWVCVVWVLGVGVGVGSGGRGRDLVLKGGQDFFLHLHLVVCARTRANACAFVSRHTTRA